ncbi:MAG: biotin-dependent carboxyltransferase family protein [Phycicoccus sp.]|nr:biotin-dependent carboxyltransferase family protein [Phycicoccus sp.]
MSSGADAAAPTGRPPAAASAALPPAPTVLPALTVLQPGPLTTMQDLGRPGLADQGVPRSGAADRPALALANRLVGSAEAAPALEVTFGGLVARAERRLWLATAGAPAPVFVDGVEVGAQSSFVLPAGAVIRIGRPPRGLRTYLAVHGGFAVDRILGSASEDTLSGFVPQPVHEGTVLRTTAGAAGTAGASGTAGAAGTAGASGTAAFGDFPGIDHVPTRAWPTEPTLALTPGPRADWVTPATYAALADTAYTVGADSNRIGVRLHGPALMRARTGELPPEALVPGAVQLPPSGQPIIFLADVPTTGGYPVIAMVRAASLPVVAQLVPGERVRLTLSSGGS